MKYQGPRKVAQSFNIDDNINLSTFNLKIISFNIDHNNNYNEENNIHIQSIFPSTLNRGRSMKHFFSKVWYSVTEISLQ